MLLAIASLGLLAATIITTTAAEKDISFKTQANNDQSSILVGELLQSSILVEELLEDRNDNESRKDDEIGELESAEDLTRDKRAAEPGYGHGGGHGGHGSGYGHGGHGHGGHGGGYGGHGHGRG